MGCPLLQLSPLSGSVPEIPQYLFPARSRPGGRARPVLQGVLVPEGWTRSPSGTGAAGAPGDGGSCAHLSGGHSLSFLSPGLGSVGPRARDSSSPVHCLPGPPAEGLPAVLRGPESPFISQRRLPAMPGVPFQPERNISKGPVPSASSLLRHLFFLVTEKREWSERLECIFRN